MSNEDPKASDVKTSATVARDSRMTLRKNNEEVLRKALQAEARKKCLAETKAFGDCAKEKGIMVAFSCRQENLAMSDCMAQHFSEELFVKFLKDNGHPPAQPPRPNLAQQLVTAVTGKR